MSKKVQITEGIRNKMRKAMGDSDLDPSNFSVYEARLVSTEPLKKSGLFKNARITSNTLHEMARKLSTDGAIPMLVMHDDNMLPVGKLFDAKPFIMANGETELRGHFAIPNDKVNLVNDLNNSIIDEVSIGLRTKAAKCSHCDFDYAANPSETMVNAMTQTCPNGHVVGEEGVHLQLSGVEHWAEQSLVNRGAANKAKIMSTQNQLLSKDTLDRLAAKGFTPDAFYLTASYEMEDNINSDPKGVKLMELEKLVASLNDANGKLAVSEFQLKQATEKTTALEAQVADLTTKLAASEATKSADVKELQAKLTSATDEAAAVYASLLPHAKAALVAAGMAETDMPKDVKSLLASIEAKGLKLHQVFGAGPKAGEKEVPKTSKVEELRKASFKIS